MLVRWSQGDGSRRRYLVRVLAPLAVGTTALVAFVGGSTAGTNALAGEQAANALPKTVTLGVLESLTGPAGIFGQQELQGAALAVREAKLTRFFERQDPDRAQGSGRQVLPRHRGGRNSPADR